MSLKMEGKPKLTLLGIKSLYISEGEGRFCLMLLLVASPSTASGTKNFLQAKGGSLKQKSLFIIPKRVGCLFLSLNYVSFIGLLKGFKGSKLS